MNKKYNIKHFSSGILLFLLLACPSAFAKKQQMGYGVEKPVKQTLLQIHAPDGTCRYEYTLTDHLGSVRAVFTEDGPDADNQLDILASRAYMPGGMLMPGTLDETGVHYRFGYQGQFAEEDDETGYNQFMARLYDPRIGRWLIPDAAKQYWNPYLAMGNNWMNVFDRDGEFVHIIAGALIGGGAAAINMAMNGELKLWGEGAGKSWAKIGIGAGTGAAIAAIPANASLLLGAGAAGGISTMGNLADQAVDLAFDEKSVLDFKNYNFKSAAIDGVISSASFGVGSGIARNMRNSAIMKNWTGSLNRSGFWKALYNNPSLAGLVSSSLIDISVNGVKLVIKYYKNKNASTPGAYMVTPEEYNNYMKGGTPGFSIPINLDEIKISPHR